MKFPNKVTPYHKSILPKFPVVLKALQAEQITPATLYQRVKRQIEHVEDFIIILDCLYLLGKIDFVDEELLCYVEDDPASTMSRS